MSRRQGIWGLLPVFLLLAACGASTHTAAVTSSSSSTKSAPPAGGATNVLTIRAGGTLSPRTVSSPAFLAIELSVASGDRAVHQVVIRTPGSQVLMVLAQGRASTLIGGLRAGRYPIYVDGVARGALIVGGEPGP